MKKTLKVTKIEREQGNTSMNEGNLIDSDYCKGKKREKDQVSKEGKEDTEWCEKRRRYRCWQAAHCVTRTSTLINGPL